MSRYWGINSRSRGFIRASQDGVTVYFRGKVSSFERHLELTGASEMTNVRGAQATTQKTGLLNWPGTGLGSGDGIEQSEIWSGAVNNQTLNNRLLVR